MAFCRVIKEQGLGVYEQPHRSSTLVRVVFPPTELVFYNQVHGDTIEGNSDWGQMDQNLYFWLGGTDHPYGQSSNPHAQ